MTTTGEERLKILQMLEEGKVTADEAATLLRALEGGRRATPAAPAQAGRKQFLRIQVTDLASGAAKVNVTVPIFDMQELEELLASGAIGKIVEVMDEEDNERVEIYVE